MTYIIDKNDDEYIYYCCLWLCPDFLDRHGAWLTFGNVDLHLIKGRPAVHADDDLIVSHIAIVVSVNKNLKFDWFTVHFEAVSVSSTLQRSM